MPPICVLSFRLNLYRFTTKVDGYQRHPPIDDGVLTSALQWHQLLQADS
jgi:hypothetical protein